MKIKKILLYLVFPIIHLISLIKAQSLSDSLQKILSFEIGIYISLLQNNLLFFRAANYLLPIVLLYIGFKKYLLSKESKIEQNFNENVEDNWLFRNKTKLYFVFAFIVLLLLIVLIMDADPGFGGLFLVLLIPAIIVFSLVLYFVTDELIVLNSESKFKKVLQPNAFKVVLYGLFVSYFAYSIFIALPLKVSIEKRAKEERKEFYDTYLNFENSIEKINWHEIEEFCSQAVPLHISLDGRYCYTLLLTSNTIDEIEKKAIIDIRNSNTDFERDSAIYDLLTSTVFHNIENACGGKISIGRYTRRVPYQAGRFYFLHDPLVFNYNLIVFLNEVPVYAKKFYNVDREYRVETMYNDDFININKSKNLEICEKEFSQDEVFPVIQLKNDEIIFLPKEDSKLNLSQYVILHSGLRERINIITEKNIVNSNFQIDNNKQERTRETKGNYINDEQVYSTENVYGEIKIHKEETFWIAPTDISRQDSYGLREKNLLILTLENKYNSGVIWDISEIFLKDGIFCPLLMVEEAGVINFPNRITQLKSNTKYSLVFGCRFQNLEKGETYFSEQFTFKGRGLRKGDEEEFGYYTFRNIEFKENTKENIESLGYSNFFR